MCKWIEKRQGEVMNERIERARKLGQELGITVGDALRLELMDQIDTLNEHLSSINSIAKHRDRWLTRAWAALAAGVGEMFAMMRDNK